jgi:uncharacterized membrane protein YagU involved in acid resistance
MSIPTLLTGAMAGLAAAVPMTLSMKAMHRLLPEPERYPLPPSEIVSEVEEKAGVEEEVDESEHKALTYISHFSYGAATGAIYAPLAKRYRFSPAAGGVVYGLAVWAGSYLGLMPALNILRPATEHPARRNALMITAHVIWGLSLGLLVDTLVKHENGSE